MSEKISRGLQSLAMVALVYLAIIGLVALIKVTGLHLAPGGSGEFPSWLVGFVLLIVGAGLGAYFEQQTAPEQTVWVISFIGACTTAMAIMILAGGMYPLGSWVLSAIIVAASTNAAYYTLNIAKRYQAGERFG